jgi:membrane associated rhomboid family serine protease
MVDLNHIFLFIAVISPLLVLARTWRPDETHRGWRVAALIVLAITAASWIFFRHQAGYIGASVWFALLFVPAIGLRKMTELAAQHRYRSAGKLAAALQILHPSAELREQAAYFRMLQSENSSLPSSTRRNIGQQDRHYRLWNAPAVLVFILLNIAAFLFEISFGDWTDPVTLHRLGALEPYAVVARGEYWRLLTALFLHAGSAHLFFNLFALYVLGPPLERSIGALRFAACYLIAGFGSSAGVVLLTVLGLVHPAQLVGASGCVMGIVGAWAGFLLRHHHAPRARQRLANIAMIVLIQIAFDLSTPQVSMAAHLCGLITGFLAGLAIVSKKMSIYARSGRFTEPRG